MKDAVRSGARWALVIGEEEMRSGQITMRDLSSATQEQVPADEIETRLESAT
jgi:histidyl-tRNA synthetase